MIQQLPTELHTIRDAAVESFIKRLPLPDDFHKIQDWLELDGWDALVGDCGDRILYVSPYDLSDEELCAYSDMADSVEQVTNAMRIQFARDKILNEFSGAGSAYSVKTICTYELKRDDGKSVVLGCLLEDEPGGASAHWHGLYNSKEEFFQDLRGHGSILECDLPSLSDKQILAYWTPPINLQGQ